MTSFFGCVVSSDIKREDDVSTTISNTQVETANNTQSIEELKAENSKIKGELEKLTYIVKQQETLMNTKFTELTAAINKNNVASAEQTAAITAGAVNSEENKKLENIDIDERYKLARKNHDQKNYAEAERYYASMVGTKSAWYDERARFFLGKVYLDSAQYKKAIISFQDFVEKYPKSKNIANAVYAQAESFLAIEQKKEAEVFLNDVVQRFPRSKEASLARKRLKSL